MDTYNLFDYWITALITQSEAAESINVVITDF